jgi:hypothetical protein
MELGKTPRVKSPLRFRKLPHPGMVSDVSQILNHTGRTWLGVLHNAPSEDMIVVSALPKQFPRQAFQVTLCRFRALYVSMSEFLTVTYKYATILLFNLGV